MDLSLHLIVRKWIYFSRELYKEIIARAVSHTQEYTNTFSEIICASAACQFA